MKNLEQLEENRDKLERLRYFIELYNFDFQHIANMCVPERTISFVSHALARKNENKIKYKTIVQIEAAVERSLDRLIWLSEPNKGKRISSWTTEKELEQKREEAAKMEHYRMEALMQGKTLRRYLSELNSIKESSGSPKKNSEPDAEKMERRQMYYEMVEKSHATKLEIAAKKEQARLEREQNRIRLQELKTTERLAKLSAKTAATAEKAALKAEQDLLKSYRFVWKEYRRARQNDESGKLEIRFEMDHPMLTKRFIQAMPKYCSEDAYQDLFFKQIIEPASGYAEDCERFGDFVRAEFWRGFRADLAHFVVKKYRREEP